MIIGVFQVRVACASLSLWYYLLLLIGATSLHIFFQDGSILQCIDVQHLKRSDFLTHLSLIGISFHSWAHFNRLIPENSRQSLSRDFLAKFKNSDSHFWHWQMSYACIVGFTRRSVPLIKKKKKKKNLELDVWLNKILIQGGQHCAQFEKPTK